MRCFSTSVLALLMFLCAGSVAAAKPNIIFIQTDDQAVRDLESMPWTLKLLRDQGVAFSNSFVSWPLCCPSRATFFTGQYAHNHNVLGNYIPRGGSYAFNSDNETLPVWLQRAGYRTTHIGKYLNGYGRDGKGLTYVPPGWNDWMGTVDPSTYSMWGYTINRNGVLQTYGSAAIEDPRTYHTDVLRALAVEAINKSAASGQPFFINLAFLAPHEEVGETPVGAMRYPGPRPAPRHKGKMAGVVLPRPPNFDEADRSDKPAFVSQFGWQYAGETMAHRTQRYQRRLESLQAVDEAIWFIVARLTQLGILDNTYIVFTSDNGFFNGEHGINLNKYLMYEASIRVPLLIRGPGLAPGTSQELVANVDLAPTFLEIAGATAGRVVDGRSMLPFARNKSLETARPILLDAPFEQYTFYSRDGHKPVTLPAMRGLRTRRFSYVEHSSGEVELYDLQLDPHQMKSAHADPLYAGIRATLREATSRFAGCTGLTCRATLR
jgi:N-acetylglucosamine-6-sulfatase